MRQSLKQIDITFQVTFSQKSPSLLLKLTILPGKRDGRCPSTTGLSESVVVEERSFQPQLGEVLLNEQKVHSPIFFRKIVENER